MKQQGFTLIELLAVIIILAVIALIATPLILGIIEGTKEQSFKDTAYGISQAAKNAYVETMYGGKEPIDIAYTYLNGVETSEPDGYSLKYEGGKPKSGQVSLTKEGKTALVLYDGKYCATKGFNDAEVTITENTWANCQAQIYTVIASDYSVTEGVNAPKLVTGMTPIKWVNGVETPTTADDAAWYDYANQKWANAKTKDGSYWVWIPRYAYQFATNYHTTTTGTINIKFLKNKSMTASDNSTVVINPTYSGSSQTNYIVHPSFWWDNNNNGVRDDGEELTGIWVAKFEPTAAEGVATITGACNATDNVTTKTIKIVPDVTSWRCISIKNAYTTILAMKNNNTAYGWTTSKIDTHMMKNTEWGAVAYLSKSSFGANAEVWNNAYTQYKTGCSGRSLDDDTYGTCVAYNSANGVKASTTYNITGVYDMRGGAWESVMADYNNLGSSSGFSDAEVAAIGSKYLTRYTTASGNILNGIGMDYDAGVFGDAIYETSLNAGRYNNSAWINNLTGSWYADHSYLPITAASWYYRGGYYAHGTGGGLFLFVANDGAANVANTFRPTLIINI